MCPAKAQTAIKDSKELISLRDQYEADLAAATKPVQTRYHTQLQKLLKTLTQRGDLPAANAVQAELDTLINVQGKVIPPGSIASKLVGTAWKNGDDSHIEFLPGNRFREVWRKAELLGTWKAISPSEADVTIPGRPLFHYKLSEDGKTVTRPDTKDIWKPER